MAVSQSIKYVVTVKVSDEVCNKKLKEAEDEAVQGPDAT